MPAGVPPKPRATRRAVIHIERAASALTTTSTTIATTAFELHDVSSHNQRPKGHMRLPQAIRQGPSIRGPYGAHKFQLPLPSVQKNRRDIRSVRGVASGKPTDSSSQTPWPKKISLAIRVHDEEDGNGGHGDWPDPPRRRRRQREPKTVQTSLWEGSTIPALIPWYLQLQEETQSGRLPLLPCPDRPDNCRCRLTRRLKIACIYWDRKYICASS